jgi:hypothetical protein
MYSPDISYRWGCWGWNCAQATPCQSSLTCNAGYCRDTGYVSSTANAITITKSNSVSATATSTAASGHRVSTGAIVGASVGSVFALVAIGVMLFLLLFRKKGGRKGSDAAIAASQPSGHRGVSDASVTKISAYQKAELEGSGLDRQVQAVTVHEIEGDGPNGNPDLGRESRADQEAAET